MKRLYKKYSGEFIRFVFQSPLSAKEIARARGIDIDAGYVSNIRSGKVHSSLTKDLQRSFKAHRLTVAQVEEILHSQESSSALARRLGFSTAAISYVRNGRPRDRQSPQEGATPHD